jgi:hypothetical protein
MVTYIKSYIETFYQKISKTMIFQLLPSILIGGIFWFAITPTDELTTTSIHLLAVFIRLEKKRKNSFIKVCNLI